jgi:hypothetical protein
LAFLANVHRFTIFYSYPLLAMLATISEPSGNRALEPIALKSSALHSGTELVIRAVLELSGLSE